MEGYDLLEVLQHIDPAGLSYGKDVKTEKVTEFRYVLVESDVMEIEKQNAVIRELELPVACLVHSGGKSLHAVVRVDAADYKNIRKE